MQIQASNSDIDMYLDDQIPRILPILGNRPARPEPEQEVHIAEDASPVSTAANADSGEGQSKELPVQEPSPAAVPSQEGPDHDSYNYELHEDIKDAIRKVADGT